MPEPEGQFVTIDGTRTHYVTRGSSGPVVALIHGAGGSSREFTFSLIDQIEDRFRVIAIDRPGHGFTDRIPHRTGDGESLAEQAALLHGLLDHLGVERAIVAGQSYGGAVALRYVLDQPERSAGAVIVSGVSNPWEGALDPWYETAKTWWGKYVLMTLASKLTTRDQAAKTVRGIFDPDPVPQGYMDHMSIALSVRTSQLRANAAQINRCLDDIMAQHTRYHEITVPVDIIHGTADTTVPFDIHAKPLSQQIPHAVLTKLDGTGHMPHHSHEHHVIAALDRIAAQ